MLRKRIYLSPPHLAGTEGALVEEAFASNWVAPLGPHVDAFEREFSQVVQVPHAVALSSGTAALHLALKALDIQPGDSILCSTLTFAASANAIAYERAVPVFVDSDRESWCIDPSLVTEALAAMARRNQRPKGIITVDLYGQSADYGRLVAASERFGVPIIEDAAEALGASYRGRPVGGFGVAGIFSFNGNKIITTSGGGMLVSHDKAVVDRARFLSTQARDPAPYYQHSNIGYNYRLSNVLAGIGRAQLAVLGDRVARRRQIARLYQDALEGVTGISFMPEASYGSSNRWLSCILVDEDDFGATPNEIRLALEAENIEARPLWKPLHMQPIFAGCPVVGGGVSEDLFARGLCLPSGSSMAEPDVYRVIEILLGCRQRGRNEIQR